MRLINDGNRPITREAFDGPCIIDFGSDADIVSAEVGATKPGTLKPEISIVSVSLVQRDAQAPLDRHQHGGLARARHDRIEIQPLLLNPGDWLQVQALVDDLEPEQVQVSARVEGVSDLRPTSDAGASLPTLVRDVRLAAVSGLVALTVATAALITGLLGGGDETDSFEMTTAGETVVFARATPASDTVGLLLSGKEVVAGGYCVGAVHRDVLDDAVLDSRWVIIDRPDGLVPAGGLVGTIPADLAPMNCPGALQPPDKISVLTAVIDRRNERLELKADAPRAAFVGFAVRTTSGGWQRVGWDRAPGAPDPVVLPLPLEAEAPELDRVAAVACIAYRRASAATVVGPLRRVAFAGDQRCYGSISRSLGRPSRRRATRPSRHSARPRQPGRPGFWTIGGGWDGIRVGPARRLGWRHARRRRSPASATGPRRQLLDRHAAELDPRHQHDPELRHARARGRGPAVQAEAVRRRSRLPAA